ncbi:glycerophosphodiester phosphodiesterase [Lederbergia panacisoli]|uniref:glycerophosphodiester phosphodiesterase n=1 Tax=Lederbergia panacisoli TaxID=1255251 RepID=UPI00214B6ECB|nr:glycerophosphodiester phosphodiesterase family protein [Lederbergia panacisoli]MCR2822973.1 glycerophosphodiester phosphodiesterase [Lederbergia panacisoli]
MASIFQGNQVSYIGAHRGASAYCPENTMSSFKKALELKADTLELDVQLTKDGEVIVFHDFYLNKSTDGQGFVFEHTLAEIQRLDAGSWFAKEFAGEKVPTLEEVLTWSRDKVWLSIELKQFEHLHEPLAKKVVQLIEHYQMEDQVQVMSFNHASLVKIRNYSKRMMTNVICGARIVNPIQYLRSIQAQVLNTPIIHLSPDLVKELHHEGFYVHASMSDDINVWKAVLEWGIDAMNTNIPDVMIAERSEFLEK